VEPRSERPDLAALLHAGERLDSLADTAELMGDNEGATRFREAAWCRRQAAMELLDD
jgi:hypothetical protein